MFLKLRTILVSLTFFALTVPIMPSGSSRSSPVPGLEGKRSPTQAPTTAGSPPAPVVREVYVIALDDKGRPITDLRQEEFRVLEDKVEQKITSVSATANDPLTVGFFFDVSGSRRADQYVTEETKFTSKLLHSIWQDGDSAFLIVFGARPIAVVQPTRKLEQFDEGLEKIVGGYWGSTALYDALCVAKPERLNAVPGRKLYVILGDFEDNSSKNKLENVVEVAHQGRISIFPVVLSKGFVEPSSKQVKKRAMESAQKIADKTGGEVLTPESPKQLAATFELLASELRAAYRLNFTPSSLTADRRTEKLKIETSRPHVRLLFAKN